MYRRRSFSVSFRSSSNSLFPPSEFDVSNPHLKQQQQAAFNTELKIKNKILYPPKSPKTASFELYQRSRHLADHSEAAHHDH